MNEWLWNYYFFFSVNIVKFQNYLKMQISSVVYMCSKRNTSEQCNAGETFVSGR